MYFPATCFFYSTLCFLYSSILLCSSTAAWKNPWTEKPGRLQSRGWRRVRHDWATSLSLLCIGEGNGNPLQCSCLENPRNGVAQSQARLKWLSNSSILLCVIVTNSTQHKTGFTYNLLNPCINFVWLGKVLYLQREHCHNEVK